MLFKVQINLNFHKDEDSLYISIKKVNGTNCIRRTVETIKFLIVEPSPPPFPSLLGPNIRLRILISNTLSLRSSLNVKDHVSYQLLEPTATKFYIGRTNRNFKTRFKEHRKDFRYAENSLNMSLTKDMK